MQFRAPALPPHRFPVVAAVGFGMGARLGVDLPAMGAGALLGVMILLGCALAAAGGEGRSRSLVRLLVLAAFLPGGTAWGAWRELGRPADPLAGLDDAPVLVRGVVSRPERTSPRSCRLFVRVEWMARGSSRRWEEVPGISGTTLLVTIPAPRAGAAGRGGGSVARCLPAPARWGDRVVVYGTLGDPSTGPRALPSYAAWLALQDVSHVVASRNGADVAVLQSSPRNPALAVVIPVRRSLEAAMDRGLPPTEAALLKAIVLAEGSSLPDEVAAPFRATGTWHVMVTAGLHVNVAIALFAALLGGMGLSGRGAALLCIPLVVGYALVVGGSPSVTRAAIMGAAVLLGHACGRRCDSMASLSVAVLAMVTWDPRITAHVGFHMSVACVVGIATLGRALRVRLRRLPHGVRGVVAATVATQMAVAPLAAACFGTVSLTAVLANVLVVPLCEAALAGGLLMAVGTALVSLGTVDALPGLVDAVAGSAGWPLVILLRLVAWLVGIVGVVPGSELEAKAPGVGFTLAYWVCLGVLARLLAPQARGGQVSPRDRWAGRARA